MNLDLTPASCFDHRTFEVYSDPLKHAVVNPDFDPPGVKVLASQDEKLKLYQKLAGSGRLLLLSPSECDLQFGAGLFSVLKDLSKDRLILDARPANGREEAVGTWTQTLASPATLGMMEVGSNEVLLSSGQDLRDYFYQFQVTPQRAAR